MEITWFRIFIALLASHAAAFAYICRLNLGLILKDMTVDGTNNEAGRSTSRSIRTEEQAIYAMSLWRARSESVKRTQYDALRSNLNGTAPLSTGADPPEHEVEDQSSTGATIDKLDWNEGSRNWLLGLFFYGYLIVQVPGGRCAELFGAKTMLLIMGAVTGALSLLFPVVAIWSLWSAGILRFLMGASQGALFPASYVLLCEWMPKDERPKWFSAPATIGRIGVIIMNLVVPGVFDAFGWESVFYGSGVVTLVWTTLFLIFASNKPSTSRWISRKELLYIESHQEPNLDELNKQSSLSASGFTINEPAKKPALSLFKLILNRPVYILSAVMFTSEWSNMIFLVKLPFFLRGWQMDMKGIGDWTAGYIAVFCIQYPLSNYVAARLESYLAPEDSLEKQQEISLRIRKIFEAIAQSLQTIGCLMIAFCPDYTVVLIALFIMMFGRSTVGGGQCMIPPELSKEFTGTVLAFANTIANIAPAIGPTVINWTVHNEDIPEDWFIFWLLSAAIFALGGVIFCLFAENRPQNYCRKSKQNLPGSLSMAQLCDPKSQGSISRIPIDEPVVMDVFSRVGQEPPKQDSNKDNKID